MYLIVQNVQNCFKYFTHLDILNLQWQAWTKSPFFPIKEFYSINVFSSNCENQSLNTLLYILDCDTDNCTSCSTHAWSARPVMRSSFLTQLLPSVLKENTVLYQICIIQSIIWDALECIPDISLISHMTPDDVRLTLEGNLAVIMFTLRLRKVRTDSPDAVTEYFHEVTGVL